MRTCRTPPGVRELKLQSCESALQSLRRTPPGVRELKLLTKLIAQGVVEVAPLPGCVN